MRVQCSNVHDFLFHLTKGAVVGKTVYVERSVRPLDGDRRTAVRFEVVLQASAVMGFPEGGEYLLQTGESCGIDYRDASKESVGSERADELKEAVEHFCHGNGLVVMPGLVDV